MADVTISSLPLGTPSGNALLPYSQGGNTLGVPVSAIFQNATANIGIGTTNPTLGKLQVGTINGVSTVDLGSIKIHYEINCSPRIELNQSIPGGVGGPSGAGIGFTLASPNQFDGLAVRGSAIAVPDPSTDRTLCFYTSDSVKLAERMRIDASGRVGIGTANPTAKLDVNGSIYGNLAGNTGCPIQHYGVMRNAVFANNIVENNFTVYKKSVCIFTWNVTAYRAASTGLMAATLKLQGPSYSTMTDIASVDWFTNEAASHKTSPTNQTSVTLLPGEYIVRVTTNVNTDGNDRANCGIIAIASE